MSIRILVVDDEDHLADTLVRILNSKGFNARSVYSAAEALQVAETFRPHALISDFLMPGTNGFGLANSMLKKMPECHVLLMSGDHEALEIAERLLTYRHSVKVLHKPVKPEDVIAFAENCAAASSE